MKLPAVFQSAAECLKGDPKPRIVQMFGTAVKTGEHLAATSLTPNSDFATACEE